MAGGAEDLDTYDAACIALADLEERFSATEFTMNSKGREELLSKLMTAGPPVDAVAEFRAENGIAPGRRLPKPEDVKPVTSADPLADLADLRGGILGTPDPHPGDE